MWRPVHLGHGCIRVVRKDLSVLALKFVEQLSAQHHIEVLLYPGWATSLTAYSDKGTKVYTQSRSLNELRDEHSVTKHEGKKLNAKPMTMNLLLNREI